MNSMPRSLGSRIGGLDLNPFPTPPGAGAIFDAARASLRTRPRARRRATPAMVVLYLRFCYCDVLRYCLRSA
jgi:hypothetical protein